MTENDEQTRNLQALGRAVLGAPNDFNARLALARALAALRHEKVNHLAIAQLREALSIQPLNVEATFLLAKTLWKLGRFEESHRYFAQALQADPDNIRIQWRLTNASIPVAYDDVAEIALSRQRYGDELKQLEKMISTLSRKHSLKGAKADLFKAQVLSAPFFLTYQEFNNKELYETAGDLAVRYQTLKYPQWSTRPPLPPVELGGKIRIGIVTGRFYHHTNWRTHLRGWLEEIDADRFSVYGYHTLDCWDSATETAKEMCTRFVQHLGSTKALAEEINRDNLHILIYPELFTEVKTYALAAMRLAPIQCTAWGNPTTSGLQTIDYFLGADFMEPEDAETHYTEDLIRLPKMGMHYTPVSGSPTNLSRQKLGLDEGVVIYLCLQSLFKYLPQYDDVFPRIAQEVEDCRFVFKRPRDFLYLERQLNGRLSKAFERYGMESDKYIKWLPFLEKPEDYHTVYSLADVSLDSIGFSGCNTTLDAVEKNLPVVMLPGKFARERHSLGIYKMMGLNETIARTVDEYIRIAAELGTNVDQRAQNALAIKENKHKVFRDVDAVKALEAFFEQSIALYPQLT